MILLDEIRRQPEHIRHTFMWLCVVIVFSLVSFVWFRSTQQTFVAMLHPEEIQQLKEQNRLAQEAGQSPLANLWSSWGALRASLTELVTGPSLDLVNKETVNPDQPKTAPVRSLPLSGNK